VLERHEYNFHGSEGTIKQPSKKSMKYRSDARKSVNIAIISVTIVNEHVILVISI